MHMKDLFTFRSVDYNLRGNHILSIPKLRTTTYGLHSIKYLAGKLWNSLPDEIRSMNFDQFKNKIKHCQILKEF